MFEVTEKEVEKRLTFDNPWWMEGGNPLYANLPYRGYVASFMDLVNARDLRRAVVLMGPRRVGKTVMLHHSVQTLLKNGEAAESIFFVSIDNPVYSDLGLERLLNLFLTRFGHGRESRLTVIFDEIQYLKDWERHLKVLVDSYPAIKFIASGSAAAALRMKGSESGAGRFTDFLLPPVTFAEFLVFLKVDGEKIPIAELNRHFIDYINYGGFPEAIFSESVRNDLQKFVGNDIIDKVLLRDLPSLYGIDDQLELRRFFTMLAFNTGQEVNLDGLSKSSGVAKNTIRKYLKYLEAAFLIHPLYRVDQDGKHFKRATHFKIHLANPTLRAALFGPLEEDDERFGSVVETAFVSQVMHFEEINRCYYARWHDGEVDLVLFSHDGSLDGFEIKWSDRAISDLKNEARGLLKMKSLTRNRYLLTKSYNEAVNTDGIEIFCAPVALFCVVIGESITEILRSGRHPRPLFLKE
jgi:predicted AAA+ superfamily ATPase